MLAGNGSATVFADTDFAWVGNYSQMLTASLVAYATGSMFLGLSYWDILYHLIVIAVLLSALARTARSVPASTLLSDQVEAARASARLAAAL